VDGSGPGPHPHHVVPAVAATVVRVLVQTLLFLVLALSAIALVVLVLVDGSEETVRPRLRRALVYTAVVFLVSAATIVVTSSGRTGSLLEAREH
jgi:hypothetical protein